MTRDRWSYARQALGIAVVLVCTWCAAGPVGLLVGMVAIAWYAR